jgi:hypothetical protein
MENKLAQQGQQERSSTAWTDTLIGIAVAGKLIAYLESVG